MLHAMHSTGQRGSSPHSPSTDPSQPSPYRDRRDAHQVASVNNSMTMMMMTAAGETAASPIPLSSPTRRQTSLSPGAYKEVGGGLRPSPRRQPPKNGGGAAHDLDDEVKMVDMVFGTLTSSLAFYQTGRLVPGQGGDSEIATPVDAANFISHFTSILTCASAHSGLNDSQHHRGGSEAALIRLIFENAYDVVGTLTSLVQCSHRNAFIPSRSTRVDSGAAASTVRPKAIAAEDVQEAFSELRLAAVECIKQLLTLSVEAVAATTAGGSARSSHLFSLLHGALTRCGTLKHLLALVLLPTSPEVLRVASVESIFVFAMRCPQPQAAATLPQTIGGGSGGAQTLMTLYDPLLKAVVMDTSPLVRCYAAAVLRHLAGTFPRHSTVIKSVPVLLRCVAQESSLDTIALCAGAAECVVRRASDELDHSAVSIMNVVETVAAALEASCNKFQCILKIRRVVDHKGEGEAAASPGCFSGSQDEAEQQQALVHEFDVLEALCNLTRACVMFTFSAVSADIHSVFRHMMLRGVVPRLAKVATVSSIRAALAATSCLSLMVLRAPPFLNIPLLLSEPQTAASIVFGVVSRTQPPSSGGNISATDDEAQRSMTALFLLETAMMTAASFLCSPLSRAQWRNVLSEVPGSWEQLFEQRLTGALSSAALDMFADVVLMDECGVVLNDVSGVDWDDDMHPSAHSIRCLLDAQEIRRRGKTGSAASSLSHWRSVEQTRRAPDTRRGYLCFVLMGFAFITLTAPPLAPDALVAHRPTHADPHDDLTNPEDSDAPKPRGDGNVGPSYFKKPRGPTRQGNTPSQRFPHISDTTPQSATTTLRAPAAPIDRSANYISAREEVDQMRSARNNDNGGSDADHKKKSLLQKEFLEALKLTIHLSSHYQRKLLTSEEIASSAQKLRPSASSGEPLSRATSSSSMVKRALTNPYAKPKVHNDRSLQLRAWSAAAVEEGDLFFFFIPLTALNVNVVDAVVAKARKHQLHAKKMFLMTPQSSRERRWFLLDMHSVIMPKLIVLLQVVKKMIAVHSEEHVRMALQVLPSVHVVASSIGEKAITCANLLNVTDFIQQTFAIRMSSDGVGNASFVGGGGSPSFSANDQQQAAVMASSFFAPLFPPPAGRPHDGGATQQSNAVDLAPPGRALFDVSSGDSEDPSSQESDDDDDPESQFRVGGKQREQLGSNQLHSQAYSIRRMSVRQQDSSQRQQQNEVQVEERSRRGGHESDDDDSSFELMR